MSKHRHDGPVPHAEHSTSAWLGQAGLYRTRLEAVQNGEQHVEAVSTEELFELTCNRVMETCIHA